MRRPRLCKESRMDNGTAPIVSHAGLCCSGLSALCWGVSVLKRFEAARIEAAKPIASLSDLRDCIDAVPLLARVSGQAWSAEPLQCELMPSQQAVITEMREEQSVAVQGSNGNWLRRMQPLRHARREARWALQEPGDKPTAARLPIVNGARADVTLLKVGEAFLSTGSQSVGTAVVRAVIDQLTGFKVLGTSRTEAALPVGTQLTAVGELAWVPEAMAGLQGAWRIPGQVLALRAPEAGGGPFIITTRTFPEVIASLTRTSRTFSWIAVGFGVVGAVLLTTQAIRGTMSSLKRRRMRNRVREANRRLLEERQRGAATAGNVQGRMNSTASQSGAGGDGDILRGDNTCVVCLERAPDTVFRECGHMAVCSSCGELLDRCPICRTPSRTVKVYTV